MNEDDINVPEVEVEDPHWKVGDGMRDEQGRPDFVIGQMAIVSKGKFAPGSGKPGSAKYDIVFFDVEGNERGRLHVTEDESAMACGPTAFGSSGIKDDIINVPEVEVEDRIARQRLRG